MKTTRIELTVLLALLLAACSEPTAGQRVTNPTLQPMAQATQFYQQALATQRAGDATVQANAQRLAATASVSTQTQIAVDQHAIAQATAAQYTQIAVNTVAAREATQIAVHDADATATAQAQIHADSVATLQHSQQSTATAVVVGTQTAITLMTRQADAQRQQIANWASLVLVCILTLVGLWMFVSLVDVLARRWSVAHYGPHRNPLVIMPGGVVYDPLKGISSADELPSELREKMALLGQEVLAIQAQHSPFPPAQTTKKTFSLGPLSTSAETAPVTESVTISEKDKPAITPPLTSGAIEAPKEKDKMHLVFVEGANMTPDDKRLCDLRELVEGAEVRGLTRAKWEGYRFATGNECTQGYHKELMDILVAAQVVMAKGKTHVMRVSTEQAIDSLGLQGYDYH